MAYNSVKFAVCDKWTDGSTLSMELKEGLSWELLYADDLTLMWPWDSRQWEGSASEDFLRWQKSETELSL